MTADRPKRWATKGQLSNLTRWRSRLFADNEFTFIFSWAYYPLASTVDSKILSTKENLWIISRRTCGSVFIRNIFRMNHFSSNDFSEEQRKSSMSTSLESSSSFHRFFAFSLIFRRDKNRKHIERDSVGENLKSHLEYLEKPLPNTLKII